MVLLQKCGIAFVVSIIVSCLTGLIVIPVLKRLKAGQNILGYVDNHAGKSGTSTMGGIIFAFSALICYLIFSEKRGVLAFISLAIALAYLIVGFLDDFIKIKSHRNEGLTAWQKILFQGAIAAIVAVFVYTRSLTDFFIPFFNYFADLKVAGGVLVFFIFIATTNCVNLTDGLDGLAGGVSYVYLLLIAAVIGVQLFIYPNNFILPGEAEEIALLSVIQSGAILGFLLYNTFSASVFMGDTGSLYLGGFIASASIFSGNAFFIPVFGIMFVVSGISVIVQVAHFKRTGKRVFLMAPLHHHFEYKGHSESKIVFVYKLITLVVGVVAIIITAGG